MRALVYLLLGIAIVAAAAFGVRHYGIDVAALAGFGGPVKTTAAAGGDSGTQRQGGTRANRGPAAVETARATTSRLSDDVAALGTLLSD